MKKPLKPHEKLRKKLCGLISEKTSKLNEKIRKKTRRS